jgi:hypothetical protein
MLMGLRGVVAVPAKLAIQNVIALLTVGLRAVNITSAPRTGRCGRQRAMFTSQYVKAT